MITSREQIEDKQGETTTPQPDDTEWEVIDTMPTPSLPPKSRPISELKFPLSLKEKEEKETGSTYHPWNYGYKHNKLRFFKYNKHENKVYDLQELENIKASSQIEAYIWQICHYLAPDNVPPSTRAYYDDSNDCDFLCMSSVSENDLDKLSNPSKTAYVIAQNQLFYIDKSSKKCTRIDIEIAKLKELKEVLKLDDSFLHKTKESCRCLINRLTDAQLNLISTISGHNYLSKSEEKNKSEKKIYKSYIGVSSTNFPGFVPNRDDPLVEDDIKIEAIEGSTENQEKLGINLIDLIQSLSNHYVEVEKEKNATSSMTSSMISFLKYGYNLHVERNVTSAQLEQTLQQFLQDKEKFKSSEYSGYYKYLHDKDKFSKESINNLLTMLTKRKAHIEPTATSNKNHKNELPILNKSILITQTLALYAEKNDIHNVDITQFVEMSKIIKRKGLGVDKCDLLLTSSLPTEEELKKLPGKSRTAYIICGGHLFYIDKLLKKRARINVTPTRIKSLKAALKLENCYLAPGQLNKCVIEGLSAEQMKLIAAETGHTYPQAEIDNTELKETVFGKPFTIKVKAYRNFCNVRGATIGACLGYLHENYDHHSRNTSKDGKVIDFDKYKWWLTYLFNVPSLLEKFFSPQKPLDFVITENDVRNFPHIQDALPAFGYWLTKQTYIAQSQIDTVSKTFWLDLSKNFFTPQDNEVFKKLAIHAICDYTKYEIFLKYILSPKQMYKSAAKLHIEKDLVVKNINIPKTLVNHEPERIKMLRNVMINMPEFQGFLARYGDYVFQSLREECEAYKANYRNKQDKKQYYKEFADSINIDVMTEEYNKIYHESGADKLKQSIINQSVNINDSVLYCDPPTPRLGRKF